MEKNEKLAFKIGGGALAACALVGGTAAFIDASKKASADNTAECTVIFVDEGEISFAVGEPKKLSAIDYFTLPFESVKYQTPGDNKHLWIYVYATDQETSLEKAEFIADNITFNPDGTYILNEDALTYESWNAYKQLKDANIVANDLSRTR